MNDNPDSNGRAAIPCPSPDVQPCHHDMVLEDCETLKDRVVWLIRVRWYVVAATLPSVAAGYLLFPTAAAWAGLFFVTATLGAVNTLWHIRSRRAVIATCGGALGFSNNQILVDFALLIVAIHCTGGVTGPLSPLFILHGVFSAVLLPRRFTIRAIMLAVLFVLMSFLLEHVGGWAPAWRFGVPFSPLRWIHQGMRLGFLLIATGGATMIGLDLSRQLRIRHARLATLARELEKRNEELKKVDEQRVRLLGVASHDLKSPLGALVLKIDLFLGGYLGELNDEQRKHLESMKERADSLRTFINDLLDLTTVELKEKAGIRLQRLDLALQLRDAVDEQGPMAERFGLTITTNLPGEPIFVMSFPSRLPMVWTNLLSNAIKYSHRGGTITVSAGIEGDKAVVSVADTGIGISGEDQLHLFKDFFRSKAVREQGIVGTGLGLSIVRRVVESTGGVIHASSDPGRGTTFTVTLPLDKSGRQPA